MKLHSLMLSHVRQNAPDALLTVSDAPWPRAVILAGPGGVGKASLTSEYAHHADYARVVVGLRIDVVVRRWTSSMLAPSTAGGVVAASAAMDFAGWPRPACGRDA